ncbi:hypothetical protein GH714_003403 [Hevea brasiliensis]|uniref:Uncharacterized protein n=1 Tax=Hevea brasiliensis TaxID=3981 RepID=A0A6A6KAH7_HEVBR|nr:hypothetical protein GH714_003403 [Hevea brasiliensis]
MAKAQYTVALASNSETTGEEKSSSAFSEIAIGIDIGTQCNVAVCNGSQVKLLKNTRIEKLMRPYVSFKEDTPGGVSKQLSHKHEILYGATIFNIKRLIGRVLTDPVVHACKSHPFLVQTFDIGVHPFTASLVDNTWRFTTPDEVLEVFVAELRAVVEGAAIGGEDILQNMMQHLLPNSESLFLNRGINEIKLMGLLRAAAQDAIHRLSYQTSVQVGVDLGNGKKICKGITQEEFEEVNHKVFEKHWVRADGNNFIPIIPQNTTMPARKELSFTASHDNQTEALIFAYEDEGKTVQENHLLGFFKIIGIPSAPRGVPEKNVCMDIDASNMLRVVAGVMMPGTEQPAAPFIEVGMPTIDDGRCWCAEALLRAYGSTLDLVTLHKKV